MGLAGGIAGVDQELALFGGEDGDVAACSAEEGDAAAERSRGDLIIRIAGANLGKEVLGPWGYGLLSRGFMGPLSARIETGAAVGAEAAARKWRREIAGDESIIRGCPLCC